jgi:hypothetical protein
MLAKEWFLFIDPFTVLFLASKIQSQNVAGFFSVFFFFFENKTNIFQMSERHLVPSVNLEMTKWKIKLKIFFKRKKFWLKKKVEKSFWQKEASAFSFLFFFSSNVNRWFSQFQKQTLKFVSIFNFTNSQKKLTHKIAICVVKLSLSIYLYLYWFVSYVVGSTFISLA